MNLSPNEDGLIGLSDDAQMIPPTGSSGKCVIPIHLWEAWADWYYKEEGSTEKKPLGDFLDPLTAGLTVTISESEYVRMCRAYYGKGPRDPQPSAGQEGPGEVNLTEDQLEELKLTHPLHDDPDWAYHTGEDESERDDVCGSNQTAEGQRGTGEGGLGPRQPGGLQAEHAEDRLADSP